MNEETIKTIAQKVYDENQTTNQFAVSQTPFHTHNGSDSQKFPYLNLKDKIVIIPYTISGTDAATAANYSTFFTAPYAMAVKTITEVHAVKGTDGSAVTVTVEKLTGTTAPGSGIVVITTPFDLKGTINTVQNAVLSTVVGAIQLNAGDRLALLKAGTLTAVANVTITVTLIF